MKLKEILKDINIKETHLYNPDIEIKGVSYNSKDDDSNMFVCISGEKFDTHNIMENIKAKIDVFIVERINPKIQKCQIKVSNTRKIILKILINFNNINKSKIKIIGITGTNGKTTTTFYTKFLLERFNKKVALIGTSGCYIGDEYIGSNLTTPAPKELVFLLKKMIDSDVEYLVMEISAHAIKQYRVEGLNFVVGCFTNLTQDHLDDFDSFYEYAYYKFLFLSNCDKRIINIDDKFGSEYSKCNDIVISKRDCDGFNYKLIDDFYYLKMRSEKLVIKTNVSTEYNACNLTLALAIIDALGFDIKKYFKYLNIMPKVDGRYNLIKFGEILVCIDYAHSPDAMEKVLQSLRKKGNDLIVVFGASGFRDSLKRKQMGKVASKYADYVILTADNPRFENVSQICEQISEYIAKPYVCIPNRYKAIEHAHNVAKSGSVIAILGKGNEGTQDICAYDFEYSDERSVRKIFNKEQIT